MDATAESTLVELMKGRLSLGAVLGVDPGDIERLVQLGRGHMMAGRMDDAQRVFDGLCALEPRVPALQQLRGVLLDARKRYPDAIEAYTRALHLFPDDDAEGRATAYAQRGIARLHAGDARGALADLALARPGLGPSAGPLAHEVERLLGRAAAAVEGNG